MNEDLVDVYLAKANEALASARSEYENGRYNGCANRCYFACFQAAVAALAGAGIVSGVPGVQLGHAFVQAQFAGQLVTRRKMYSAQQRDVLSTLVTLRQTADYRPVMVSQLRAQRALNRAGEFVAEVSSTLGEADDCGPGTP